MRIGILTGGGDCPGLNAVIRAVVRRAMQYGFEVIGIRHGWTGLIGKPNFEILDKDKVSGILTRGGTILGTSRMDPFSKEDKAKEVIENLKKLDIDALIVVGGNGTLSVAQKFCEMGAPIVGVPKTIDNDVSCTDVASGFETAVNIATEAIDRLHTTAESHNRVIVVEVMGRNTGWIATESGIAGGADCILIPEKSLDIDYICRVINKRRERGRTFSIVVVAEGSKFQNIPKIKREVDEFGHIRLGGIGYLVADEIKKRTGFDTRVVILGHIQRGGAPSAFDRVLGTRFGIAAVDLVKEGKFGKMVALHGTKIVSVEIADATKKQKIVDKELYETAEVFFG